MADYTPTGVPVADSAGASSEIRAEFVLIETAIATKLESGDALGTPASGVLTNCTGTAAGLTAGNVTTNANLTGHVTSVGNAAVLGSFTLAQLNTAVSDANVAAAGSNGDITALSAIADGTAGAPSIAHVGDTDTGMWFPAADTIAWSTGGVERLRIDSSGNIGVGATPASKFHVAVAQGSPTGIGNGVRVYETTNNYGINFGGNGTYGYIQGIRGAGTTLGYNDIGLQPNGGNTLHLGSTGGLGYGVGAGGTVTQATSKSTDVTLNKPTGTITTHNAALGAGAFVAFVWNNSLLAVGDRVTAHRVSGGSGSGAYTVWVDSVGAGSAVLVLKNVTGGSLSEAVDIGVQVHKGATS